ncbi:ASCH domain-containing protein [Streptomyces cavernicola]|uniref:ASCH domain-containing protein n=1 Tax=Streptomyces cavernicola TaxID=3043613 RepID=A0ABT6SMZ6_9ACTN|nr:ASCH domain-containing protein [Streptomyces sp. B-S-A6]MDI3408611.1 ASCH domain-containing protein [Streptomyces sp. B-S-A6]
MPADPVAADGLPPLEFAFPGPLRDALVAAVLSGAKTSTTGLFLEGEELPRPGDRQALIDSAGRPVAVVETTGIRVIALGEVDLQHALDEGEGYATVAEWRSAHEEFWHSDGIRAALGDPGFTVDDATRVVAERFRVVRATGADAV